MEKIPEYRELTRLKYPPPSSEDTEGLRDDCHQRRVLEAGYGRSEFANTLWRGAPYLKKGRVQYIHLGRSGLKVSRLCLGTMNFGPETSEADSFLIMDRALELGINFFDTANVYGWKVGEGATEQIIGRWFAQGGIDGNEWS